MWAIASRRLLFVDIPTGRIFSHDPDSGELGTWQLDRHVSAVHPVVGGGLVVATREGVALLRGEAHQLLCAPLAAHPGVRMNDGNVDPAGRLFVGSMSYDCATPAGSLFRVDDSGIAEPVLTGVTISNGIDWSVDGNRMYYIDSTTRRVDVFDYDPATGVPSGRRTFVTIDKRLGLPDGLTVDADDGVWVALFGGGQLLRFTRDGALDHVVEVPGAQLVTSCCFGGSDLDLVFVSTSTENLGAADLKDQPGAGQVYAVRPGHRGKPGMAFAVHAAGKDTR